MLQRENSSRFFQYYVVVLFMESNRENALKFQIVYEKKLKVWPTKRVIFSFYWSTKMCSFVLV